MEVLVEKKASFEWPMGFYGGMFIFFMLASLDGLITAERAVVKGLLPLVSGTWFVVSAIPVLWIFGVMLGLNIWIAVRRGQMARALAGTFFILLGMGINFSYEALWLFTPRH